MCLPAMQPLRGCAYNLTLSAAIRVASSARMRVTDSPPRIMLYHLVNGGAAGAAAPQAIKADEARSGGPGPLVWPSAQTPASFWCPRWPPGRRGSAEPETSPVARRTCCQGPCFRGSLLFWSAASEAPRHPGSSCVWWEWGLLGSVATHVARWRLRLRGWPPTISLCRCQSPIRGTVCGLSLTLTRC